MRRLLARGYQGLRWRWYKFTDAGQCSKCSYHPTKRVPIGTVYRGTRTEWAQLGRIGRIYYTESLCLVHTCEEIKKAAA